MSIRHLDHLFDPASVAVIGASQRTGSVGATVWRNLHGNGFKGRCFAVNRNTVSSTACRSTPVWPTCPRCPSWP